jgi:hypothetical protein
MIWLKTSGPQYWDRVGGTCRAPETEIRYKRALALSVE